MINNQGCVNGILAAVLSASVIPLHGALAKERSARLQRAISKHRPTQLYERDAAKAASATPAAPAPSSSPAAG